MITEINNLSKEQLRKALYETLKWHEKYYADVEMDKSTVSAAFFMFSGSVISIREEFNLPPLK